MGHEWITGTAPDMPYDSANYEQLIRFNKERGAYCYSAHALAGGWGMADAAWEGEGEMERCGRGKRGGDGERSREK